MHQHELGYALGMYDDSQSPQVEVLRRHCEETINNPAYSVSDAEDNCKNIENYISHLAGTVSQFDARYFSADKMPNSTFQDMYKYSDKVDEIVEALHITKPDRFSKTNKTVAAAL